MNNQPNQDQPTIHQSLNQIGHQMAKATTSFYDNVITSTKTNLKFYLTYISLAMVALMTLFLFVRFTHPTTIWNTLILGSLGLLVFYNAWVVNFVMEK